MSDLRTLGGGVLPLFLFSSSCSSHVKERLPPEPHMNNFAPKSDGSWGYLAPEIITKLGNWLARRFPILGIIFWKASGGANAYVHVFVATCFQPVRARFH